MSPSPNRPEQWFWPAIAAIALTLAAVQITAARQESQIWDEGFEIVAGYQYLTTGQYLASLENPPLERILEALPLLLLHPDLKGDALQANNTGEADVNAGLAFLYQNRIPADKILFAARLPMIAISVALVLVLAAWTRRKFGALAGIAAALLFSLDPTVIAHGHYVKNDMTVTALAFVAVIAWNFFLKSGEGKRAGLVRHRLGSGAGQQILGGLPDAGVPDPLSTPRMAALLLAALPENFRSGRRSRRRGSAYPLCPL